MTEAMIEKARRNAQTLGYTNVEFQHGEIENMPLADETADVVISNCTLNLVPDKRKAFSEIRRVLKKAGHFTVSDMVLNRPLPDELKAAAELYALPWELRTLRATGQSLGGLPGVLVRYE